MRADLPPDVRRFILTSVPSVPFLEALLLLRSAPQDPWRAARLAARLYIPERQGGELLRQLAEAGLVTEPEPGSYTYAARPELSTLIDEVAHAYAANLVAVTDLIHSRVDKRAQQFADAFRLRKDKDT